MEVLPKLCPKAPVKSVHAQEMAEPGDQIRMYNVEILWVVSVWMPPWLFGAIINTYTE